MSDYTIEQQKKMNKEISIHVLGIFQKVIELADKNEFDRDTLLSNFISGCIQVYRQGCPFDEWKSWDDYSVFAFSKEEIEEYNENQEDN